MDVRTLNARVKCGVSTVISIVMTIQPTGCIHVSASRESKDGFACEQIALLDQNPAVACAEAIEGLDRCPESRRCPDIVYTAAICQLEGLGNTPVNTGAGTELLGYAAACGIIPAQERMQRAGIPLPKPLGRLGYAILPPSGKERSLCGVTDNLTLLGMIGAVPVAAVVAAAAVVMQPYCATKWLATGKWC